MVKENLRCAIRAPIAPFKCVCIKKKIINKVLTCKQIVQVTISWHGPMVLVDPNFHLGSMLIESWDSPLIVVTWNMSEISLKLVSMALICNLKYLLINPHVHDYINVIPKGLYILVWWLIRDYSLDTDKLLAQQDSPIPWIPCHLQD